MTFQEFLNKSESVDYITKRIIVGDRFKDEDGNDYEFEIKAIKASRLEEIRESVAKSRGRGRFNDLALAAKLVAECTVTPNFKSEELIRARKVNTAEECVQDILLPGEIDAISGEIGILSGFGVDINTLIKEAKN